MTDLPTVVDKSGLVPRQPADIWQNLLARVSSTNPGYTANLPGSLVEDISSTDVAAIVLCDSARVETVNSLTPYGANAWLLNLQGQLVGVKQGASTRTSVPVVFSGPPGYVIPVGFTVSDGAFQYTVIDGGIIAAAGISASLSCTATEDGSWVIPANTVTELVTSVPATIVLTCTNPLPGTPGQGSESESDYRTRVLQAYLAASMGMPRYFKTIVNNVVGVQSRLISMKPKIGGGWQIIVGGGDQYEVAYAIFQSILDVSTVTGSIMSIDAISNDNPGVISTVLNHNYSVGDEITITEVEGMTTINGVLLTVTGIVSEKSFEVNADTSAFPAYTVGGRIDPNPRNVSVQIIDYPDVYQITYVNPPQQTVAITVTWNTSAVNFVSANAIAQLAIPAITAYVNSIHVGNPINQFVLEDTFQESVASVLSRDLITRMIFAVSINGIGTAAISGTGIIAGDPESYFFMLESACTVQQG